MPFLTNHEPKALRLKALLQGPGIRWDQTRPSACGCAYPASLDSRERTSKRRPAPFSGGSMPPRPSTTSIGSWACFQYPNCGGLMSNGAPSISPARRGRRR